MTRYCVSDNSSITYCIQMCQLSVFCKWQAEAQFFKTIWVRFKQPGHSDIPVPKKSKFTKPQYRSQPSVGFSVSPSSSSL